MRCVREALRSSFLVDDFIVPPSRFTQTSDRCLKALNSVFSADLTGVPSLEIVRILSRMIKERRFKVHPNVMSCLLNLRLRTELGIRASQTHVDKPVAEQLSFKQRQKKKDQPHLSKKAKKALKERKEIEKDLREAEAEVDKEERAITVSTLAF